ncbi:MAG: hypothetical protein WDA15_03380 [Trueperaceae bacterium]
MVRRTTNNGPEAKRSRYGEYDYLLGRVDRWSMLDLDDLMLEIEKDESLTTAQRKELLERVYAILWRRAQLEMRPPRTDNATKRQ